MNLTYFKKYNIGYLRHDFTFFKCLTWCEILFKDILCIKAFKEVNRYAYFYFLLKKYTHVHTIVRSRPKGVFEYIIYSLSLPTCVVVQIIYKNNL